MMLMIEPHGQDDWPVQWHNGWRGMVVAQVVARQALEPGQVVELAEQ